MKIIRIICFLASVLCGLHAGAQFNPTNPAEPGTPQPQYTLTVTSTPAGASSWTTGSSRHTAGERVSVSTGAASGFRFLRWDEEGGSTVSESQSFSYVMPERNVTLVARFEYDPSNPSEPSEPEEYATVNITASPSSGGYSFTGAGRFPVGSTHRVSGYANSSFRFVNWTLGEEVISESQWFDYTVRKGDNNLTANYVYDPVAPAEPDPARPAHRLDIRVLPSDAGYIFPASGSRYAAGEAVYISATPYSNYRFAGWRNEGGELISADSSYEYTMPDANTVLTATFEYAPYNPDEPGALQPSRNIIYGGRSSASPGSEVFYDINLENVDPVTGFNIDVAFPAGYEADWTRALLTSRASEHTLACTSLEGNGCRIQVRGVSPIAGGSGAVVRVPLRIPADAEYSSLVAVSLTHGVVINGDGSQDSVGAIDGFVKIADEEIRLEGPDFMVRDLAVADATLMPGDPLELTWSVVNDGTLSAAAGWSEMLSLVDSRNRRLTLSTLFYETAGLAPGESVSRSARVAVPEFPGMEGKLNLRIDLIPNVASGEPEELQLNNSAQTSGSPLTLGRRLMLTLPEIIGEGAAQGARCSLSRSGDRSEAQSFNIVISPEDSRLDYPPSITIPADRQEVFFQISVRNNDTPDSNQHFVLTAEGNGYAAVSAPFEVEDNDLHALEVALSKDEVTEGESFELTVILPESTPQELRVSVVSDLPARFRHPSALTIAAGSNSGSITVSTVDDTEIQLPHTAEFTISAEGYDKGTSLVEIFDNDIPELALTLTPSEVVESCGASGVTAVLRRLSNTDKEVTLRLSDNSAQNDIYYPYATIQMQPGETEVEFPIGIMDNELVDGTRRITITAAVYVRECSCSPASTEAGSVSALLTVIDDDGQALTLTSSSSSLLEGDKEGITLTVSRNSSVDRPCTVFLSSDGDERVVYPKEVFIPLGERSVSVKVTATANDKEDDGQTILFSAESEGFSKGICWIMLTDRTLPDAVIESISVESGEVELGEPVKLSLTVANKGVAKLPDAVRLSLYADGIEQALADFYTDKSIAAGERHAMSLDVTLPDGIGEYSLYAVVNGTKSEKESLYTNNTSFRIPVKVLSPFRASIEVEREQYRPGEEIRLTGHIDGKVKEGDEVEVYVINGAFRHSLMTTADASGDFSVGFTPFDRQFGAFTAGACYPGENSRENMTSFVVFGLKEPYNNLITHECAVGERVSGSFTLVNPAPVTQSGVKASVISKPDKWKVELKTPSEVKGNGEFEISYSVVGNAVSPRGEWEKAEIIVETAQGATFGKTLYLYSSPATGALVTSVEEIKTTMSLDQPRDYSFRISNTGRGETGVVTLALPEWIRSVTPRQIPSLAPNDTVEVLLRLFPTSEMQLNVPVSGRIGLNCAQGEGLSLPFSVEPVSERGGTLVVDVCDEYTYYTAGAPHVEGAEVSILHPVSNALLAQGTTGSDGLYSIELPEGFYRLKVVCADHESYQNVIMVDPGRVTTETVSLSVSAVKVSYTVEETEVEDEYKVVTKYTYATDVPAPVVVIRQDREVHGEDMAVGESVLINFSLTNEGLIMAENVRLDNIVAGEDWHLEFIGDAGPFDLPARQTRVVPMLVTRVGQSDVARVAKRVNAPKALSPCVGGFEEFYEHNCNGRKLTKKAYSLALQVCAHSAVLNTLMGAIAELSSGASGGGGGAGSPGGGGGGGAYSSETNYDGVEREPLICDDDALDCADALVKKLGSKYPGLGNVIDVCSQVAATAADNVADNEFGDGNGGGDSNGGQGGASRAKAVFSLGDGMKIAKGIIDGARATPVRSAAQDLLDLMKGCYVFLEKRNSSAHSSKARDRETGMSDRIEAFSDELERLDEMMLEFFGDREWFETNPEESARFFEEAIALGTDTPALEQLESIKPAHISKERLESLMERLDNREESNSIDWRRFISLNAEVQEIEAYAREMGHDGGAEMYEATLKELLNSLEDPEGSVCSKIKLNISQSVVMTRQAFRGTLVVENGSADTPLSNVSLTLDIRDAEGNVATSREFQTNLESLSGFSGEKSLDGPWSLDPKKEGIATMLFIPTRYAAPEEGEAYTFGGVLRYTDPYSGLEVSRELSPVSLTVNPSPVLDLTYFMQRDVYGDDPFTPDVVEPSLPGEFALVIDNIGYGDARNLRIMTSQPEIVENEKGLLVDFELVSSQINGQDATLSFGESILSDFGTVAARSAAYAQWWLESSLMGHFMDYDVEVNHVTSYGNPDLSLINSASIHQLTRGFTVSDSDVMPVRGFLVNDNIDAENMPETLYFSDGAESLSLQRAPGVSVEACSETEYLVSLTPSAPGWTYLRTSDPTSGRQSLLSVIRQSDGRELPVDNFWQTAYTIPDKGPAIHEKLLHGAVELAGSDSYLLTFSPRPEVELTVVQIEGVPDEGKVLTQPLESVTVIFNKEIEPESFSGDDLDLYCEGKRVDASGVAVSRIGECRYLLSLKDAVSKNGFYVLTVNTSGITDTEGFPGSSVGRSVSWVQNSPTSVSEILSGELTVYPQPMRDQVRIGGDYEEIESIEFFDSRGIICLRVSGVGHTDAIDVSSLHPDLYLLRLKTAGASIFLKAFKR